MTATLRGLLALSLLALLMSRLDAASDAYTWKGQVEPFLKRYCIECHQPKNAKAGLDLTEYSNQEEVRADIEHWQDIASIITAGDMPPASHEGSNPSTEERQRFGKWFAALYQAEARKHSGDPGVLIMRRLTPSEYEATVTDLTGSHIQVAQLIPKDAVGGEGFSNVGAVQNLTPQLLERYHAAATAVANDAVFRADGVLDFEADMTDDYKNLPHVKRQIKNWYDTVAKEFPELFSTRFLSLGSYLQALEGEGDAQGLSPKYLAILQKVFSGQVQHGRFVDEIVQLWKQPNRDLDHILSVIRSRQAVLDRLGAEPKDRVELRLKVPLPKNDNPQITFTFQWNRSASAVALHVSQIEIHAGTGKDLKKKSKGTRLPQAVLERLAAANPSLALEAKGDSLCLVQAIGTDTSSLSWDAKALIEHIQEKQKAVNNNKKNNKKKRKSKKAKITIEVIAKCFVTEPGQLADVSVSASATGHKDPAIQSLLLCKDPAIQEAVKADLLSFQQLFPRTFFAMRAGGLGSKDWRALRVAIDPLDDRLQRRDDAVFGSRLSSYLLQFCYDRPLADLLLDAEAYQAWRNRWADMLIGYGGAALVDANLRYAIRRFVAPAYNDNMSISSTLPEADVCRVIRNGNGAMIRFPGDHGWPQSHHVALALFEHAIADRQQALDRITAAAPQHLAALKRFASRAWRRPLSSEEEITLTNFYTMQREHRQLDHLAACRRTLVRILMSPYFIYLPESAAANDGINPLSDQELAVRLSYFIWSSTPDQSLLELVAAGRLHDPDELRRQVERMLADPRSKRLASDFFGRWLTFDQFLVAASPDAEAFPDFAEIRSAVAAEPRLFAEHLISSGKPVSDLLFANYSIMNESLAQYYNLKYTKSKRTARPNGWVVTDDISQHQRGGLLGMAALHTLYAEPLRSSPVRRGAWILQVLLGVQLPPVPADVPDLPEKDDPEAKLTLRQHLERHRNDPNCASCHAKFDGLGLALERYDAIGRLRNKDAAKRTIDDRGFGVKGPASPSFSGLQGLKTYLQQHRTDFIRTCVRKLIGYGMGRKFMAADADLLEQICTTYPDPTVKDIVTSIVISKQFRHRRGSAFLGR